MQVGRQLEATGVRRALEHHVEPMRVALLQELRARSTSHVTLELLEHATLHLSAGMMADNLVSALDVHLAGAGRERVEWPATWWQAVRARWLPAWWLRRWPVELAGREVFGALCPHTHLEDRDLHLAWLRGRAVAAACVDADD